MNINVQDMAGFRIDEHSGRSVRHLLWVTLTALAIDVLIFEILFEFGVGFLPALTISFVCSSVFSYVVCSQAPATPRSPGAKVSAEAVRFIAICLLGFGLRGGVLSDASQFLHWPPLASIVAGAGASAIVSYLGGDFLFFKLLRILCQPIAGGWPPSA